MTEKNENEIQKGNQKFNREQDVQGSDTTMSNKEQIFVPKKKD